MARDRGPIDVTGLGFRLAIGAAGGLLVASLVSVGLSLRNGAHSPSGAPLASLDVPQLLSVESSHGAYDPLLSVSAAGATRALVTERGGSCVAFGPGLAQTSELAVAGGTTPGGIRAAPYCAGALLPSGALAFAAISPTGVRIVGTLGAGGTVTNGAPLPGPTIVFGSMWLTGTPSGVYLVAETEGSRGTCCFVTVWHSSDGVTYGPGRTLPEPQGEAPDPATFFGPMSIDPRSLGGGAAGERLYVPFTHAGAGGSSERQLGLAVSDDGGSNWREHGVVEEPPGVTVAAQYPVAAVDSAGAVYVAWSDVGQVWYAWSKDEGATVSAPQPIDDQAPLNVMPAIVAGDAGHIAVAWYAGTGAAAMGRNASLDAWHPMLAVSGNADNPNPGIARLTLSGVAAHQGSVCLLGAGCADAGDGGPADPRLGAHLALALDPASGGLEVAFAGDSGPGGEPVVRVVHEHCGERILVRPPRPLPACG